MIFILGHSRILHGFFCSSLKVQLNWICSAGVRSHSLNLLCSPLPQDTEHCPQAVQGVKVFPPVNRNKTFQTCIDLILKMRATYLLHLDTLARWEEKQLQMNMLPGHPIQSRDSVPDPTQSAPPFCGGGFVHVLVLVSWPRPQVLEHLPHADQGDHPPSTSRRYDHLYRYRYKSFSIQPSKTFRMQWNWLLLRNQSTTQIKLELPFIIR